MALNKESKSTARHRTAPRRTARYRRAPRAPHRHASTARTLARLHACPHAHTEAHQSPWPQRGNARHGTAPHGDYCTHARPRLTASHAPHARTHACTHASTYGTARYRTHRAYRTRTCVHLFCHSGSPYSHKHITTCGCMISHIMVYASCVSRRTTVWDRRRHNY